MTKEEPLPPDQVREFVIAAHGNLPRVKELLAENPRLLNASYPWSETDREAGIQAAAQVGSAQVAEYLLSQGVPLNICTAAMLGRKQDVERFLDENPALVQARGAHGIPLMPHAAMSGDVELAKLLWDRGAREGVPFALVNAIDKKRWNMARWLLENCKPDLSWKNYQGKTALAIALEAGDQGTIQLLREHGAV